MFQFWLNHPQGACSLCFVKLLYWYQLIYWVIKIVRSWGRMLPQDMSTTFEQNTMEVSLGDFLNLVTCCRLVRINLLAPEFYI